MPFYLGYDPGGEGKQGVAVLEIADGKVRNTVESDCLKTAVEVLGFFDKFTDREVVAIGIDTLLSWSLTGKRKCDDALKEMYKDHEKSVLAQNSLASAMTLNGVMVARELTRIFKGVILCETHPKLLRTTGILPEEIANPNKKEGEGQEKYDHRRDAIVAAWAASRHEECRTGGNWFDLYEKFPEEFPFDPLNGHGAIFPWPQKKRGQAPS